MSARWKMALLTWPAVWLVSTIVRTVLAPALGPVLPEVLESGVVTASVVSILTWIAMPLVVRVARPWLYPKSQQSSIKPGLLSHSG